MLERLLRGVAVTRHRWMVESPDLRAGDAPVASAGPGGCRVLLVGAGITSGWGVGTHGLALSGALQEVLARRLDRPVEVELVTRVGATADEALDLLGDRAGEEWDAVVVAFGVNDALRLTPVARWEDALAGLLGHLGAHRFPGPQVPVLLAGIPPMDGFPAMASSLTPVITRHAQHLDAASARIAARDAAVAFLPMPAMIDADTRPLGSPEAYRAWAEVLATDLAERIPSGLVRAAADEEEDLLPAPVAAVRRPANAPLRRRLEDLVAAARTRFSADVALLAVLDGDRLWTLVDSASGSVRRVHLSESFCRVTLLEGVLHVPAADRDERFAHLPIVRLHGVDSYAGAVVDDGGRALGTLCVYNGRIDDRVDLTALRVMAAEAAGAVAALRSARGVVHADRALA